MPMKKMFPAFREPTSSGADNVEEDICRSIVYADDCSRENNFIVEY